MGRRRYCRYLVRPFSVPSIVLIISDNHQRMCLTLGLWNGKDRMLKERMFGLNGGEGTSLSAEQFGADMQEITEKMSRKCTGTSTLPPLTRT
jgi:hypothetical protein